MSRSLVVLSFCVLAGCGGATETNLYGDASTTDGGTVTDATANDSGHADARPDAPPDAPTLDCKTLIGNLNELRNKAVKCDNGGNTPACDVQVDDLCCPLTVTGPASRKEVMDFEAAVKATRAGNCPMGCTPIPCASQPTLKCPNGTCQQF